MVRRDLYLNRIAPLIDNELIKVITGIRRCGKSYMLGLIKEELINRGIDDDNIILINFESAKYRNVSNARELDLLIESLVEILKVEYICFLMRYRMLMAGKNQLMHVGLIGTAIFT